MGTNGKAGRQRSARHDGWSAVRRQRFLEALAQTGSVGRAAREVGMTASGAYQLRARDREFHEAWMLALRMADDAVVAAVRERVIDGVEKPVFHKGQSVGSQREFSDRLAIYLLDRLERMGVEPPGGNVTGGRAADALCDQLRKRMERLGLLAESGAGEG